MRRIALLSVSTLAFSAAAQAQPVERGGPPPQKEWTVTLGLAPVYSPLFTGSKDYALSVFPDLRVNYKDDFFASVPDGMGYNVINQNGWKVGPLAKIRFSREEDEGGSPFRVVGESKALRGMGTVDTAGEVGGFAQYTFWQLRTRAELRQGFGGHEGLVGDLGVSYFDRMGAVNFSFGPRLSFGSEEFINTYYGINPGQSARTGLGLYKADGGITTYGLGGSLTYAVNDKMAVTLFGSYDQLGNQLTHSPLIRVRGQEQQAMIGLGFGYRFGWNNP